MPYKAPLADMLATMRHAAGLDRALAEGFYGDLSLDLVTAILEEAGDFAGDRIALLNRIGDIEGATFEDGAVTMPHGFKGAYRSWTEAGWSALAGPERYGGQGLPYLLNAACVEMWNAASMAFGLGPLLTMSAVEAIRAHADDELKLLYLPKLISGEWTGTMNLTEPQAGSDLSLVRMKAARNDDGTYRLSGEKIYITYGEHDLADNIVHLVLARLDDAPEGHRGLSLFLAPKILPDGSVNDLRCAGIEHKLGIHASPTCTLIYGDRGGAKAWLIGEENKGLACMFTMMNHARLAVGLQGVAIAECAFQQALAYACERRQGRATNHDGPAPIIAHPDIRRILLTMKASIAAARALCYKTAFALDRAHLATSEEERRSAESLASLLTPIAKAFSTDIGVEVASLNIQIHGGMGYIEETGAAQHWRDARINPIYEGTNGIQAIDLLMRKATMDDGFMVKRRLTKMRQVVETLPKSGASAFGFTRTRLSEVEQALEQATNHLLNVRSKGETDRALAAATSYLRLFALAEGGTALAEMALAAKDEPDAPIVSLCRFFAENIAIEAQGLKQAIVEGSELPADVEKIL